MNAVLPKGVSQAIVTDGRVFLNAAPAVADRGLALSVGYDIIRFEIASGDDVDAVSFIHEYRPTFNAQKLVSGVYPATVEQNEQFVCSLNANPKWRAANRDTVQVQFKDREATCEIELNTSISVPPHEDALVFSAGLAAHRANARLILSIQYSNGSAEEAEFLIARRKMGGTSLSSYNIVHHDLPPTELSTTIRFRLAFDGHDAKKEDLLPFLFLAGPHVSQSAPTGDIPEAVILRNEQAPGGSSIWLCAALPSKLQPFQELRLLDGGESYTMLSGGAARVELTQDYGHTLMMTASQEAVYRFEIDGESAFQQVLKPQPTAVRLPVEFQTGYVRRLNVLNETGTQMLFSDYILVPRLLTPLDVLRTESSSPFPGPLMAQAGHRYAALKAQLGATRSAEDQMQLAHCLAILEGGHKNVTLDPLSFPVVDSPDVSVVIPAHNKIELTYLTLASLLLASNTASFEVIVVDDGSTDETATLEDFVSGITVVHNKQSQRFIRACNAGVAQARGTYVALLNNDVEVTTGWLDALIDGFERFDNVGQVGSKLLYPNGKLQEAGGIIWGSGNPWNYGNGSNPWDPRFCYARQADYLSGAAMMTTRAIWDEVGGLSSYLEPMYFEDTDFSFKVRQAGYKTYAIPSSIVYHYEGMTSGTDTSSGFKRYQEVNRPKFKRRWASAFSGFGAEGVNPDLEKDRGIVGRVLFIDYATPRPDRDAGSYAAVQEIKLVQSLGYKVTFLPNNLAHMGSYTDKLQEMGVEVIYAPFFLSIDDFLEKHARDFDAFFITRFYVARGVMDKLRRLAPATRILFNNADLHFLRELRAGIAASDEDKIEAARKTRDEELAVMRDVDVVLSYNDVEHAVIQSHTDGSVKVTKCPWVVDIPENVPGPKDRKGISFLGNYQHTPNAEGIIWFTRQVMPLVEADHPDAVLTIYGSAMTDEIRDLKSPVVDPRGFIPDIADAYNQHRIFVAPLLTGAGIKGKVLAALAHGIPCVLSPTAAEGVGLRHEHDCLIATTPPEWRDAINALMRNNKLWMKLSRNARTYVSEQFSFATGRELMRAAFEQVDLYSPVP
jgi:GT2 family glycosyltransferase